MLSNCNVKIYLLLLLSLFAVQTASAQFYKQNGSLARIVKRGIVREQSTLSVDSQKKKGNKKKRPKSSNRAKNQAKKESVKVAKESKGRIEYTGRKYRLGERIIMRGDSGNDVKSLANILVEKLYLDEKDIVYTADGGVLYEGEIVRALRLFQQVSGMHGDGIVGKTTLKALRRRE